jgi:hypothetical protein
MANGFPPRDGDVDTTRPFAMVAVGVATGHGSPYAYDAHVPVILFGPPIRPGRYRRECSPTDIVPTLASILGIERPASRDWQSWTTPVLSSVVLGVRRPQS